jgi:CheY-like chemotaxis protein
MATILVVDDEFDIREMIETGLELDGYRVLTVDGGEQAIAVFVSQSVDLVISDIKMPSMDGVEMLARLRELAPMLPVIVASGYLAPETLEKCMALGGVTLVRKPFAFRQLAEAVQTALAGRVR